ncbi:hypothetical protein Lal_00000950 [Lupinus albus]|nr:hypothetical protein Lal_00000950 [Lupinus albus]
MMNNTIIMYSQDLSCQIIKKKYKTRAEAYLNDLTRNNESEELYKCCAQLNKLNNQRCQCRALQQIFENQSEQLEGRQQEQQLEQELEKLCKTCGFGPLRMCDITHYEELNVVLDTIAYTTKL